MKMGIITFLLLTIMTNGYAKTAKTKFVIGDITGPEKGLNCGYYLKSETEVPYLKKVEGLKKFIINDEECTLNIVNYMKQLNSQDTQIQLYNIIMSDTLKNDYKGKQLVVKAIAKMDFLDIQNSYPLLVEAMLQIFEEDIIHEKPLVAVYSSIYNEKIEALYELRKEVAQTIAILADKYPDFMNQYIEEIERGLKHPVYLDSNGESVIDLSPYTRDIEIDLREALDKLKK